MKMPNLTDQQIQMFFKEEGTEVLRLLEPLMELSANSSTLVLGYGRVGKAVRSEMLPYFHVCGAYAEHEPVRALIVGGWVGQETTTTYTIARLLARIEATLHLAAGIEVTAYPIANLVAYRAGRPLTDKQEAQGITLWSDSESKHIRILEHELNRYPYDVVILLREKEGAREMEIDLWAESPHQQTLFADALSRYGTAAPGVKWEINPEASGYARSFTPMPESGHQPAEITVALPGALSENEQADAGIGILLTLLHTARQARAAGAI